MNVQTSRLQVRDPHSCDHAPVIKCLLLCILVAGPDEIFLGRKGLAFLLDPKRSKDRIHPQSVARAASEAAKHDAVFVLDTGLNTLWSANWIRQSGGQRIIGSFNNAAVGTALGQANGIQALDRARQVIVLSGDGRLQHADG